MKYFSSTILLLIVAFIGAAFSKPIDKSVKGAHFDRIVSIIFENANYDESLPQPYFQDLINHDNAHDIPGNNLVDLLEAKGVSWKGYMEDYPGHCYKDAFAPSNSSQLYARKHNPFMSMININTNSTRCDKIVDLDQLDLDIETGDVPQYAYIVPNQIHDGHGIKGSPQNITSAVEWFKGWFEPKLKKPTFTLFFIYFDEDDHPKSDTNHIFAALLGHPVHPPSDHTDDTHYTLYSFLATVEEN
ncbi:15732_t:CDS:2 [Racocetra persica]|uniref:15732_t:CDS:1 n=1 Tax=Racocetra persica TaxID=160502 RepID=A0ACA9NBJ6_9GLOM|nr:15732_t:CDS:2 [Racocetra persica]